MGRSTYTRFTVPQPTLDAVDWMWLDRGQFPAHRRVWSDGVDVTDQPVSTWPTLMQISYANGWRPLVGLDGTFMP